MPRAKVSGLNNSQSAASDNANRQVKKNRVVIYPNHMKTVNAPIRLFIGRLMKPKTQVEINSPFGRLPEHLQSMIMEPSMRKRINKNGRNRARENIALAKQELERQLKSKGTLPLGNHILRSYLSVNVPLKMLNYELKPEKGGWIYSVKPESRSNVKKLIRTNGKSKLFYHNKRAGTYLNSIPFLDEWSNKLVEKKSSFVPSKSVTWNNVIRNPNIGKFNDVDFMKY